MTHQVVFTTKHPLLAKLLFKVLKVTLVKGDHVALFHATNPTAPNLLTLVDATPMAHLAR
jgi:hypothetical protein